MNQPPLRPGQYSGLLVQASTGIVLNQDGRFFVGGSKLDFFIFENIAAARTLGRSLVNDIANSEFSIWNESGVLAEVISA